MGWKSLAVPQAIQRRVSSKTVPTYVVKRNENVGLWRSFYTNIYNSQKAEIVDGMY